MDPVLNPDRPHLILLPGLPGTGQLFDLLARELGDRFDIDAISYPQDEPMGYEKLLPFVTSRIPKEKPYFILGESFSGPLSIMAGNRIPENLLGIILVATFVTSPMSGWINSLERYVNTPFLDMRPVKYINNRLMGAKCDENTRSWVHRTMPRLKRDVLAARIESVLRVNVREELKNCQVPVLYIAGANDWLVGKKCIDVIWLCRPDVQIRVLDGCHMILQTNARDSAESILEFCGKVLSPKTKAQ